MSAIAVVPVALAAAGFGGLRPAGMGAPEVCRMPAAPWTMSPKAWVTKGKLPSWSSVNSAHPPCEGARFIGLAVVEHRRPR